jgi:hypothetical protein
MQRRDDLLEPVWQEVAHEVERQSAGNRGLDAGAGVL